MLTPSGFSQWTCLPALSAGMQHGDVPVVGRGDVDGVDVLLREEFAEVGVHADAAIGTAGPDFGEELLESALGVEAAALLRIADGDDFDVVEERVLAGFEDGATAAADDADGDAVAGGRGAAAAPAREEARKARRVELRGLRMAGLTRPQNTP